MGVSHKRKTFLIKSKYILDKSKNRWMSLLNY